MTWTKLSDDFADELDAAGVSPQAFTVHVSGIIWCMRLLTDGRIPARKARTLYGVDDPDLAIKELVDAGYWAETPTGFEIVNFLADQRSAEAVQADRKLKAERQKRWRDKTSGKYVDASTNASRSASSNARPAQPSPAQKDGLRLGADGSPGGSPQHPAVERPKTDFHLTDMACQIEAVPADGTNYPLTPGHTVVEFTFIDERIQDIYSGGDGDHPHAPLILDVHKTIQDETLKLARRQGHEPRWAKHDLYGALFCVPTDQASLYMRFIRMATDTDKVWDPATELESALEPLEGGEE